MMVNGDMILKTWKGIQDLCGMDANKVLPCPRCGCNKMKPEVTHNAWSRRADIYICPACGTQEALEDFCAAEKMALEDWHLFRNVYGYKASDSDEPYHKASDESYRIPVTSQIIVTNEDIDDIMVSALEGGITYWCDKAEVVEDEYYGEYASDQISRGGSLRLYDMESGEKYILDLDKFLCGVQRFFEIGDGFNIAEPNTDGTWKISDYDIDAAAADEIVQYGLFGEIVYA